MILYRVGDLLPALSILVKDGSVVTNLTTLDVFVRWQKPDGSMIPERQATVAADPTTGIANYVWLVGDLDQEGIYRAIIQLSPDGNPTQRYSLTNPPLVEIEVLENVFQGIDTTLPMLPQVSGYDVSQLLQTDVSMLDGNRLITSIERGRSLTYVFGEFWRCPGIVLSPVANRVAKDLITSLAAREYTSNPVVMFGPYKKETFGSYSYEMKETNVMSTRQQTGGKTGIPNIDAMIDYLIWLNHDCGPVGMDIIYPDWLQPITYEIIDPLGETQ